MKTINLQDALHRKPFTPFEVKLDNGQTILVKHPELVLFSESETTVIITEGEHFHIFDVANVSSASAHQAQQTCQALNEQGSVK